MLSNLIADAIHVQMTINNIIISIFNTLWSVGFSSFDKKYCPVL